MSVGWWDPDNEGYTLQGAYEGVNAGSLILSLAEKSGTGHSLSQLSEGPAPSQNYHTGWYFAGDQARALGTGFTPAVTGQQTVILQYRIAAGHLGGTLIGCGQKPAGGSCRLAAYNTVYSSGLVFDNGGCKAVSRAAPTEGIIALAGTKAYFDGEEVGTIDPWTLAIGLSLWLGALHVQRGPSEEEDDAGDFADWADGIYVLRFLIAPSVFSQARIQNIVTAMKVAQWPGAPELTLRDRSFTWALREREFAASLQERSFEVRV